MSNTLTPNSPEYTKKSSAVVQLHYTTGLFSKQCHKEAFSTALICQQKFVSKVQPMF